LAEKTLIYGNNWCPDCYRAKIIFKKMKAEFLWINIDSNASARKLVMEINNGNCSVPTIVFADGSVLVEPSSRDLEDKLRSIA